jgi:hypothetical protein
MQLRGKVRPQYNARRRYEGQKLRDRRRYSTVCDPYGAIARTRSRRVATSAELNDRGAGSLCLHSLRSLAELNRKAGPFVFILNQISEFDLMRRIFLGAMSALVLSLGAAASWQAIASNDSVPGCPCGQCAAGCDCCAGGACTCDDCGCTACDCSATKSDCCETKSACCADMTAPCCSGK